MHAPLFNLTYKESRFTSEPFSIATPLGKVVLEPRINSTHLLKPNIQGAIRSRTSLYIWENEKIHLELLKTSFDPNLLPEMRVDGCEAFLCRFEAKKPLRVEFFSSLLANPLPPSDPFSSVGLFARMFEGSSARVTMGTENEEALQTRAKRNDWLPSRFAPLLTDPIEPLAEGFALLLPPFHPKERGQFFFIIAWSKPFGIDTTASWLAINSSFEDILKKCV